MTIEIPTPPDWMILGFLEATALVCVLLAVICWIRFIYRLIPPEGRSDRHPVWLWNRVAAAVLLSYICIVASRGAVAHIEETERDNAGQRAVIPPPPQGGPIKG